MSCDNRIKLLKFRLGECIVDDVAVAEDTQEGLDVQGVGLYIGAGKSTGAGTYWSGMIDDVRIYDVALTAEQIPALVQ